MITAKKNKCPAVFRQGGKDEYMFNINKINIVLAVKAD